MQPGQQIIRVQHGGRRSYRQQRCAAHFRDAIRQERRDRFEHAQLGSGREAYGLNTICGRFVPQAGLRQFAAGAEHFWPAAGTDESRR